MSYSILKPGKPQREIASCMETIEFSSLNNEPVISPVEPENDERFLFNTKKLNELLPSQISKNENGYILMEKIADKGFQKFISSDQFKSTSLGQLNEQVKKKTKVEINIKENSKLEHKLSAQLEPFQKGASLGYRGYFGAMYSFYEQNRSKKLRVEEVLSNKKLFYENYLSDSDRFDQVGIQWDW